MHTNARPCKWVWGACENGVGPKVSIGEMRVTTLKSRSTFSVIEGSYLSWSCRSQISCELQVIGRYAHSEIVDGAINLAAWSVRFGKT